jgi:hypothetical protein
MCPWCEQFLYAVVVEDLQPVALPENTTAPLEAFEIWKPFSKEYHRDS